LRFLLCRDLTKSDEALCLKTLADLDAGRKATARQVDRLDGLVERFRRRRRRRARHG
jgi:hypothetical protein